MAKSIIDIDNFDLFIYVFENCNVDKNTDIQPSDFAKKISEIHGINSEKSIKRLQLAMSMILLFNLLL
jgi:hypothetical protein